jgi:hypothetical protein
MRLGLFLICSGVLCAQSQLATERCRLEGKVVNSVTGEPVRRARVIANGQMRPGTRPPAGQPMTPPPQFSATTDAEGRFAFDVLEPGRYALSAQRDGFSSPTTQGGITRISVSLAARENKTDVLLRVLPLSIITGRIRDEQGDPVRRVQVSAMVYQYSSRGKQLVTRSSGSSNDLGEYRMFDLPPGKYYLKASPQPVLTTTFTRGARGADEDVLAAAFYPGVSDPEAAAAIEARPGEELRGIDLILRRVRGVSVRGRVVKPAGASGAGMVMLAGDATERAAGVMDAQGGFEIRGVTPGTYDLTSNMAVAGKRYAGRLPIQVGAADIEGLELRLQPPMDLNGVVRVEGNSSLNPAQTRVALEGRSLSFISTVGGGKEEGAFTIKGVEPGVYKPTVSTALDLYVKSVRCGNAEVGDAGLDLSGGAPCDLSITLSANGGQIDGRIDRDSSGPAVPVFVTLVPSGLRRDPSRFKMSSVDPTGGFRLPGIAPGAYRLYAWEDVDATAVRYDPDYLKAYESLGQSVQISENGKETVTLKVIGKPADK